MSDSIYTHDFLVEPGLEIKQESLFELGSVSASVPIPQRRIDLADFGTDLDLCLQDSLSNSFAPTMQYSKTAFDTDNTTKTETFKMDDDDIFQVDKADLILGPTLAELNANPDSLLDDLNFDDLLLPEENGYCIQIGGAMSGSRRGAQGLQTSSMLASESPCSPYSRTQLAFSPSSQHSSASSSLAQPMNQLPELLLRLDGYSGEIALGQSVPASTVLPPFPAGLKTQQTQLSSSAPTHLTMEQIWQRREPRKHLLSTSSLAEAGSVSSLSGGLLSPGTADFSQDEDDRDNETDEDKIKIAGKTSEYVNKILDNVRAGQNNGGLKDI
ncbi:hypothetical protein MSG28_009750 [Choristoneura fumiferana]|uniref:Uncharacterized protein n=1 Tax=Choristoneura fumiferana TaxID=7141 RepID=A0ACC0JCD2_CHOFU|nr:hypothetical protein MSG28_009750 [Choristoneura fumiferana]